MHSGTEKLIIFVIVQKRFVDAYDGNVVFYITDETDPIVQTYNKIYPSLFSDEPMPQDLKRHVRYPEKLFKIQSEMYKQYHITDAHVFYNKSDVWDIAKEKHAKTDISILSRSIT